MCLYAAPFVSLETVCFLSNLAAMDNRFIFWFGSIDSFVTIDLANNLNVCRGKSV